MNVTGDGVEDGLVLVFALDEAEFSKLDNVAKGSHLELGEGHTVGR